MVVRLCKQNGCYSAGPTNSRPAGWTTCPTEQHSRNQIIQSELSAVSNQPSSPPDACYACRLKSSRAGKEFRPLRAKPDKKIVDLGSDAQFAKCALHFDADGFEVPVQGTGILGSEGRLEFLSRGKQWFDNLVPKQEQCSHGLQAPRNRLIPSGLADATDDLFTA